MKIKLPEIKEEVLEIEFPDGETHTLKLKHLTPYIVSKNEKEIDRLNESLLKKEITRQEMSFSVLSLGVEITETIKEKLLHSPDEYLNAISEKLADMRQTRIETVKKNISETLS